MRALEDDRTGDLSLLLKALAVSAKIFPPKRNRVPFCSTALLGKEDRERRNLDLPIRTPCNFTVSNFHFFCLADSKLNTGLGFMPNACSQFIARALSLGALGNPRFPNCQLSLSRKSSLKQSKMDDGHCDASRGSLIVLEGLDRCGKTSQSSRLVTYLESKGFSVESWRFPDRSTGVGGMISSYLASKAHLDDQTVHLLFSANRWEKKSLMENKLKSGTTLIVDRYAYSGVAFSAAKGLDIEWCKAPDRGLLAPDAVVYLDILPEKAAQRGGYGGERYEKLEFQRKVAEQYRILQDDTWKVIDACCPIEDVEKQIRELVLECISKCQEGKPLSLLWSQSAPSEFRT